MTTATLTSGIERLRLREHQLFLALTLLIGVLAGLLAVLFTLSIAFVTHWLFGTTPSHARLFLIPPLVSIVTGILLVRYFPDVRGSGVPQTEASYRLSGGVIPGRVPIGKFLTGVLCIGCGHSIGREGPSVQIGGGVASVLGRWLELPPARVRSLVPVAAAAALAAAFNTPVSAVLFALEEIIGDMNASLIGSAVVASVAAAVVERSILGNEPLFHVPAYRLVSPVELIAYAALGIIGGVVSLAFCKGLLRLRAWFLSLPPWTKYWQPAMGGVAIGAILLFTPQVMGVGYQYVDQALNGGLLWKSLVILCAMKLVATVISYSSGNAGGIFAPALYLGAMAGGALGVLVHHLAPDMTAGPGAYALVGMGTLFAGIVRAPMTSVFMVFEITQDYQIMVPIMIANLLSFAISRRYQPTAVYHALLEQDHIHLPKPPDLRPAARIRAHNLMERELHFTPPEVTAEAALVAMGGGEAGGLLVGTQDRLEGVITRQRLQHAVEAGQGAAPIGSLVKEEWPHVHPDHPLEVVLERFDHLAGLLPVVSRLDDRRLEGVVTTDSIVNLIKPPKR